MTARVKRFTLTIDIGDGPMSHLDDVAVAVLNLGERLHRDALAGATFTTATAGEIQAADDSIVGRWVFDGDAILTDEHRRVFDEAARFIRGEYEGALRLRASLAAAGRAASTIDALSLEREAAQQLGRADGYGMAFTQVQMIARQFGLEMPL